MNFNLATDHPVALDSPDHIYPRCTKFDNSFNFNFNLAIEDMYKDRPSVLDFGCAGGAMVASLIHQKFISVGLEGSDYNLKRQAFEWAKIPDNLFTCDIGYPFTLSANNEPYKFNVITMWEFLEHIPTDRLNQVLMNADNHLLSGGFIIGSISKFNSINENIEHHLTRKEPAWWYSLFGSNGFVRKDDIEQRFSNQSAWVRTVNGGQNFVVQKQ